MSTLTTTTCPYATILYDIEISSDKVTSVLHSADTHAMSTLKVIV